MQDRRIFVGPGRRDGGRCHDRDRHSPAPPAQKDCCGKAMQRMGNAMDQALESVAEKMS